MARQWRQLAPHFLAMLVMYVIAVVAVWMAFELQSFWVSLVIALAIALLYPSIVRSFGLEPEAWKRDTENPPES